MTKLQRLWAEQGQSPWLDNLTRGYLRDGTLARFVGQGIRGVTANPTIIAEAISGSDDYDDQIRSLLDTGHSPESVFWELAISDITEALAVLRPVFVASEGTDGFVSIEVSPSIARDTASTVTSARRIHQRIGQPNLMVKIPATAEGAPAIRAMVAEGRNINVTLIFSLSRYDEVMEAYLSGLESLVRSGGDPSTVSGVASFFVGRVDAEVDKRLRNGAVGPEEALSGRAAVSQARLAYRAFSEKFSGHRWERLASLGARPQRPLWASTSPKNPALSDTLYVDELIGPNTVTTLQEATISRVEDHGRVARTVDQGVDGAVAVMTRLAELGIDMAEVGMTLESQGLAGFESSVNRVQEKLAGRSRKLPVPSGVIEVPSEPSVGG